MNQLAQLEQQLCTATSRQRSTDLPEETQALQQSYLALADLLDEQTIDIDEARLVAAVLHGVARPASATNLARTEAWLAMLSLAASLLLIVSLATMQFSGQARLVVSVASTAATVVTKEQATSPEIVPPGLAWDDNWEAKLDEIRDSAADYRTTDSTHFESTAWNAGEALRELQADLNSL